MTQLTYTVPTVGSPNSTEDPKIASALSQIQSTVNGNLDSGNLTAATLASAGINGGSVVKGAVNIATAQSTSSASYTTLATPDQVTGIVLPTNGLIRVWYQAQWQESVAHAARAAIFIGANQIRVQDMASSGVAASEAITYTGSSNAGHWVPLASCNLGLVSNSPLTADYGPDLITGQVVGMQGNTAISIGGNIYGSIYGGACDIFAAAGTYTVSVQFKTSSGTVTAQNRKLWVQALSFT